MKRKKNCGPGTKMNSDNSTHNRRKLREAEHARKNAGHGDFFFAKWSTSDGFVRESPCFVISDHEDPHDEIIVLKCTSHPKRTEYDIEIGCLRRDSIIRVNKIYTIQRSQLLFPLRANLAQNEYQQVKEKLKEAMCLNSPE